MRQIAILCVFYVNREKPNGQTVQSSPVRSDGQLSEMSELCRMRHVSRRENIILIMRLSDFSFAMYRKKYM